MKHIFIFSIVFIFSNCSTDQVDPTACGEDEFYNQITGTCVQVRGRNNEPDLGGKNDVRTTEDVVDSTRDMSDDTVEIDVGNCDKDDDGERSIACGGMDCDDEDPTRASTLAERCDEIDNNCNGENNEQLDCTFFAHSAMDLYKVDPFQFTAVKISGDLPNILDIDTHPDGRLFGINASALYVFNTNGNLWQMVGAFGETVSGANGMAIDVNGVAFITAGQNVYTINLSSGRVTRLGSFGGTVRSSGDCVVNKANTLYMSSSTSENIDRLVSIDRPTGRATDIGAIGFDNVYALVAGWGNLYGLTSVGDDGQLIKIDPSNGQGTLLHTFPGIQFFGSASDPQR